MKNIIKFDMKAPPIKQRRYLTPLAWLLSFPEITQRKLKVNKYNMKGLKPPYLLLSNHMAFVDFKVATKAIFPYRANYVVAIDGFLINEWLLRNVGCICKRKFTNDLQLIKHMRYAIEKNKSILALYPEARYSLCGTTSILPESLGKVAKLLNVPVVMLNMHGNYLSQPFWNLEKRKVRLEADMTQILTQDDLQNLPISKINETINKAFIYDEYKWQKENNIKITFKNRAKGLHKILYQCPHCLKEFEMDSDLDQIWCNHCHKRWQMTELGELKALNSDTEFSHIPDWFEFQRANVREEILAGKYFFKDQVIVDSLPNAKAFIRLGEATLTHSMNGFTLEGEFDGEKLYLEKLPLSQYSVHIEYDYQGKGDCIDLSTLEDTYYLYPKNYNNIVTKIHFATEELYKIKYQELTDSKKLKQEE